MILHIANDYAGSKVYMHLVKALSNLGVEQSVYTALRDSALVGRNNLEEVSVHYRPVLTTYCRINYYYKRRIISNDIINTIDFSKVQKIHAHTWFSDGGVALSIKKKFGIPYAIAIRNSDINTFWRYLIHLRCVALEILREASTVIFISEAHKQRMLSLISRYDPTYVQIIERAYVIPNGIDDYWLAEMRPKPTEAHHPFRLVYVGKFDRGKNVPRLIQAITQLNEEEGSLQYHLTLVGGTGKDEPSILKSVEKYSDQITLRGWTTSPDELRAIYRSCDTFAMPSLRETFGLVYIEAMTQGLPALFTFGEGIDGIFPPVSALGCNSKSVRDIADKIKQLRDRYSTMSIDQGVLRKTFRWDKIANQYKKIIYRLND